MKNNLFLISISLFLMVFSVTAQTNVKEAEDISMKSTIGQTYNLFPYLDEGKIVVLTFFTTT